ncbi:MAG: hypothetical protein ABFD25_04945 [Clostridiaceae bacterium]
MKRLNKIICVILATIFISVPIYFYNKNYSGSYLYKYNSLNLEDIDTSLIDGKKMKTVLMKSYFTGKNYAGFSSAAILSDTVSLYQMDWVLNIMRKIGSSDSAYASVKEIFFLIEEKNKPADDLEKLRQLTSVYKNLGIRDYDKTTIKSLLLKHFDSQMNLFYWKESSEDIASKLTATQIALEILDNMEIKINECKEITNKLLNLYADDEYFACGDIKENLINRGGPIISSLKLLGVSYTDISKKRNRMDWVKYYNNNIFKQISYDPFSSFVLKALIDINGYFGNEFVIDNDYLDVLFKQQSCFEGTGLVDESFSVEPNYLYTLLEICNKCGYNYPYITQLNEYINNTVECEFKKYGNCNLNIIDNYYGIALSNTFGFQYDKERVKKRLSDWFITMVGGGSSIESGKKLADMFYLLLSYKELNIPILKKNEIYSSVEKFLFEFTFNPETLDDDITYIRIGLELINLINKDPSRELINKMNYYISKIDIESFNSVNITELYLIDKYVNHNKANPFIVQKTEDMLNQLYQNGGYVTTADNKIGQNIGSTFKAFNVKKEMSSISQEEQKELKNFLNSLHLDNYIFKFSSTIPTPDLRTIYTGCKLSTYL